MNSVADVGDSRPAQPVLERNRHPLLFIRHGETDWNRELRLQGQRDTPLNALGRAQAARNGRAIAGILRVGEWRHLASPLRRASQSMEIVLAAAGRAGAPFATDERLMEVAYGDWEGLTLPEVAVSDPAGARRREEEKWDFQPPNGESYAMLSTRVGDWLGGLEGPTLVVAHGGILRVLLHLLADLPAHEAPYLAAPQDRVFAFTPGGVLTI